MDEMTKLRGTNPATQRLAWRDERGQPRSLPLDGRPRVTIGRGSRADVRLRDHSVSRRHASIELLEGQHLLRDAGSANGTFLNGLRLTAANAFALRDGDAVDIGATRLIFEGPDELSTPGPEDGADDEEACYPLADLLADGEKDCGPVERASIESAALAILSEPSLESGLEAALGLVVDRIVVTTVAIYLEDRDGEPRARAARPSLGTAGNLLALAAECLERREGRLAWGPVHIDLTESGEDTHTDSCGGSAAVPFFAGARGGVLAVQRSFGDRIDVRALAHLAVIGRALGQAVAAKLIG
jgi:hypothetical protein